MNRTDFLKQVNENRLLPSYLFLGEEMLFHEELLGEALNKILDPADREFNFLKLYAPATESQALISTLETPPFFGNARVVYLVNLEQANAELEEAVLKGITHLADGVYFFVAVTKLDGRKKNHQELQKRISVVDCSKISAPDLPNWIKQRSEKMGLHFTATQIRMLAQRLGPDLLRIRTELEKILTFCGKPGQISDGNLEALIPNEPESDIFGLIDAVAQRNPKLGLPRLEVLLNAGENELKILATLARQFRNITAANAARSQGLTPKILAGMLGINPYVAEKSFLQSGQFNLVELQKIHYRLLLADYRIKTGQREPRLELELAVTDVCTFT